MKLLIPVVGDQIRITKSVKVGLKNIAQNTNFLKKYDEQNTKIKQIKPNKHHINLSKGTILTIDRVYIRQGDNAEFNSITFKVSNDKNLPNGRFFLSVDVVNTLEINFLEKSINKAQKLKPWVNKLWRDSDRKKNGYTLLETEANLEELYSFDIKINLIKMFHAFLKEADNYTKETYGIPLNNVHNEVITYLEEKDNQTDKDIEDINGLKTLKNEQHKISQRLLRYESVNFSSGKFYKTNNPSLEKSFIVYLNITFENDVTEDILRFIKNLNFILQKLDNKTGKNNSVFNFFRKNKLADPIDFMLSKDSSFKHKILGNAWNSTEYINYQNRWDSIIGYVEKTDGFFDYSNIKNYELFNPKDFDEISGSDYIAFEDKDGELNLKSLRSNLTKYKKEN